MFDALTVPQFRVLWIGMLFSMAAMQMNVVARAWLAYDITGSGLAIGLVAVARGAPRIFIAPFGGVAADRVDKRILLLVSQTIMGAVAVAVAVLVMLGLIEIWHLMVAGLFQGLSSAFMIPTRTAFISDLVGENRLPNAIALDSTGRNLNRVVAPALAGILIAVHPALAFYAIALAYVFALITMVRLPTSISQRANPKGVMAEAADGFRYVWGNRTVFALLVMTVAVILLGMPFRNLLPVFQEDVLNVGPSQLGFMFTAMGLGAISASLFVAYFSETSRKMLMLITAGLGFGVFLSLFAMTSVYWMALPLLYLVGFASNTYLTLNKTLVMLATDRELYGRVMSIYMMGFSAIPLALLPMGAAVDAFGAPLTVATAGVLLTAAVIIGGAYQGVFGRRSMATASAGDG